MSEAKAPAEMINARAAEFVALAGELGDIAKLTPLLHQWHPTFHRIEYHSPRIPNHISKAGSRLFRSPMIERVVRVHATVKEPTVIDW